MSIATYSSYDQAKAAHDGLVAARSRALRKNETSRAQSLRGAGKQYGQFGVPESSSLRINSAANQHATQIRKKYDPQITSLYTQMQGLKKQSYSTPKQIKTTGTKPGLKPGLTAKSQSEKTRPFIISEATVDGSGTAAALSAPRKNSDSFSSPDEYVQYLGQTTPQNENGNAVSEEIKKEMGRLRSQVSGQERAGDALSWLMGAANVLANAYAADADNYLVGQQPNAYSKSLGESFSEGQDMVESMRTSEKHKREDAYQQQARQLSQARDEVLREEETARNEAAAAGIETAIRNSANFADYMAKGLSKTSEEYSYQSEAPSFLELLVQNMNAHEGATGAALAAGQENKQMSDAAVFEKSIANPAVYAAEHVDELLRMDTFGMTHKGGIVSAEYLYMTDEEIQIYSAILAKDGREKADEYIKAIDHRLEQRRAEHQYASQAEWAAEHPWAASGLSVATNLGQAGSFINTAGTAVYNLFSEVDKPVNQYSPLTAASRTTNALREGTARNFTGDGAVGKWLQDHGMTKEQVVGLENFLYGTGMSVADCAASLAVFGPNFSSLAMSANAAGATAYDAAQRGLSAGEALALSAVAGAAEYFTEKMDIDRLLSLADDGGKLLTQQTIANIITGSGAEATEELITSYTNTIADIAIAGDKSQYQQYIAQMMESGMSRQQAKEQANYQFFFLQPMQDAAAGALSGFAFNAGAAAYGDVNTRVYGQSLDASNVSRAARATGNAELTALADVFDQKRVAGTADNFDLGALQLEVDYYNALNDMQKLAYDLEPAAVDGTASLAEQMAYKIATGEKLTIAELNRLDRDHNAVPALGRLLGLNLNNTNYIVMRATLNSTATKNAKSNANLLKLEEQYQQRISELEAAREQQRQAESQQQQEQVKSKEMRRVADNDAAQISTVQSSNSGLIDNENAVQYNDGAVEKGKSTGISIEEIKVLLQETAYFLTQDILKNQSKTAAGPCLSVIYDSLTGEIAHGQNFKKGKTNINRYLNWLNNEADPLIREIYSEYDLKLRLKDLSIENDTDTRYAAHSEVVALDQILRKRRELDLPVDATIFSELYLQNTYLPVAFETGEVVPMDRCENCRYFTNDINMFNHK